MSYSTSLAATATLIEVLDAERDNDYHLAAIEITGNSGSVYTYIMSYHPHDYDEFTATDEALRAWLCDDENSPVRLYSSVSDAKSEGTDEAETAETPSGFFGPDENWAEAYRTS